MAMYSLELRQIIENGIPIFNFDYEFYDFKKKDEFERNFIRHFYFREIGVETVDKFRWYLEDKMKTVFPYYNELLKTAAIEYNILDNYNVKEEYTIKRENKGKTAGVFSSRGRINDEHSTEDNTEQNANREVEVNGERQNGVNETINNTTSGNETENGEYSKSISGQTSDNEKVDKRFLDTPQGKLNLETTDYLTTMNLDQTERSGTSKTDEEGTNTNSRENSGQNNTVRNVEESGTEKQTTSGTDKVTGKSDSTFTGEQRTTHDNNSRTETVNEQTETYEHIKKGNIGVDTDSDMIMKHIKLQKTLRRIEQMFFDECEDLFMMVF